MYIIIDYKWGVCCFVVFFDRAAPEKSKRNHLLYVRLSGPGTTGLTNGIKITGIIPKLNGKYLVRLI
jgi:hypothetical protein